MPDETTATATPTAAVPTANPTPAPLPPAEQAAAQAAPATPEEMAAHALEPAAPEIDTSELDQASSYVPQVKSGTPLCIILEFGPSKNKETQAFQGWSITLALAEEWPDEYGAIMPVGTRIGQKTIFTTESQYRDLSRCIRETKRNVAALNDIVYDPKADPKFTKADALFAALPAHQKTPGRLDEVQAHYDQWKNTVVRAVIKTSTKDGQTNVNVNGLLARSTPAKAA